MLGFRSAKASHNSAAGDDTADFFLAKTIQKLEEEINDTASSENAGEDVCSAEDFLGSGTLLATEEAQNTNTLL